MRQICSVLYAVATLVVVGGGFSAPAVAGRLDDCHKPPPAWYTAPRLTHTYSYSYGAGYGRGSTHEYSAQRRYDAQPRYTTSNSRRYRDPFARW